MTIRPWVATVLLSLASASAAFADSPPAGPAGGAAPLAPLQPVVPLDRAAAQHWVDVRGVHPESYTSVELRITSRVKDPLTVDLAGRYLLPRSGRGQRLGLGYPEGVPVAAKPDSPPGTWAVTLAPGETKTLRVHCCCMDAGKPTPAPGEEFTLATDTTPKNVETALRWWAANPMAPQGFVNEAIWQSRPELLERPWAGEPISSRRPFVAPPSGRNVFALGGMAYLLDEGELVRVDAEGARFFVATGIYDAVPLPDGLLAVGRGMERREVWRFAHTGEPPWTSKFELFSTGTDGMRAWPSAVPAAGGATLLVGDEGVALRTAENPWKDLISEPGAAQLDVAPVDAARTHFVALVGRNGMGEWPQFRLYDVDVSGGGRTSLRRPFWKAQSVAAGPGGIFQVTPAGHLERLDGSSFVRLETKGPLGRVLAVGLDRVIVADEEGRIGSVEIRTGALTPLAIPPSVGAARDGRHSGLVLDPLTDDLLWDAGTSFKRLKRGAEVPETLR